MSAEALFGAAKSWAQKICLALPSWAQEALLALPCGRKLRHRRGAQKLFS
jgi:hypothetical protein